MIADLSTLCARCGHSKDEHATGCCTNYGVGNVRVDPVCFCTEFVAYPAERIAEWNTKRKHPEAA